MGESMNHKGVKISLLLVALLVVLSSTILVFMKGTYEVHAATKVKLNETSIKMLAGESYSLYLKGTKAQIKWTTSDNDIASVSSTGNVTALKAGNVTVVAKAGNKKYYCRVKVRGTADVIIFMGQSNMSGLGDKEKAPVLLEGAGYEYKAITNPDSLFVLQEPFGEKENKEGGLDDTSLFTRSGSLVTSFVNQYYNKTDTPVIAISASRGSAPIRSWLEDGLLDDAKSRYTSAFHYLNEKGIKINHQYMVWMQGESDGFQGTPASVYESQFESLYTQMQLLGIEKCFVIRVGEYQFYPNKNDEIIKVQTQLCKDSSDFVMASTLAVTFDGTNDMRSDGVHYTQSGLNKLGKDAGGNVAFYVLNNKERNLYDPMYDNTYIADK